MTNNTNQPDGKFGWSKALGFLIALLPSLIALAVGVAFTYNAATKIHDPENYLAPFQRPLAQDYAVVKLFLGGGLGVIAGGSWIYLGFYAEKWDKKWNPVVLGLQLISVGSALLCAGALPKPEFSYHPIPLTDFTIAWSPFRIAFVPGWIIGVGIMYFVVPVKKLLEYLSS